MSELNGDIDNLFREIVDPAEMQPPQMVWTAIENNLEKKEHLQLKVKYRRLLVFSVASSSIIVSLLTMLFYKSYENKKESSFNSTLTEKVKVLALNNSGITSLPVATYSKVNTNTNPNSSLQTKTIESQKKLDSKNDDQLSNPKLNSITKAQTKAEISPETTTIEKIETPLDNSIASSVLTNSEKETESPVQKPNVDEILNSTIEAKEDNENSEEMECVVKTDSLASEASPLSVLKLDSAKTSTPLLPIEDYKFYVGVVYSPEKVFTNLIDLNTKSPVVKETQNYSYSSGIRFGYKFANRWSLSANIVYSSTSKSFDYQKVTFIDQEESEHHRPTVYPTSDYLATSYGEFNFPTYYKPNPYHGDPHENHFKDTLILNVSGVQKISYISVPLECQYQVGKNRLSGMISLGFSTNILISQNVELTYNNSGAKYSTNIGGLQDVYFNGIIGIGVQYRIFNRFSVFVQPSFSQAFTPISLNTPYKTYPSSISGSAGLNFHF